MVKEFRSIFFGLFASLCVLALPAGTASADHDPEFRDIVAAVSADVVEYPFVDLDVDTVVEPSFVDDFDTTGVGGIVRRLERQPARYGLTSHLSMSRYHLLC